MIRRLLASLVAFAVAGLGLVGANGGAANAQPTTATASHGCASYGHYDILGNKTIFSGSDGVDLVRTCGPCSYSMEATTDSEGVGDTTVYELGQFLSGSTSQGCRIGVTWDYYDYTTKKFSSDDAFYTSGSAQYFGARAIQATGSSKTGLTWDDESLSVYWSGNGQAETGWLPHDIRMCAPAATGDQTEFCGDGLGEMKDSTGSTKESFDAGAPPSNSYDHTSYE